MALSPILPPPSFPRTADYGAETSPREVFPVPKRPHDLSRLTALSRLIGLWHLTSLDAPTVAIVWCLAFARAARDLAPALRLPLWLPIVLGLCAWVFYIADRLLDMQRAKDTPLGGLCLRARHHFHWKNRRWLLPLALAAGLTALMLVIRFMPAAARNRNTLLAAATLAYFGSVHAPASLPLAKLRQALRIPKELLVGIVFTAACALPVLSRIPAHQLAFAPVCLLFAALAWLNCHAIESWESGIGDFALGARPVPRNQVRLQSAALSCAAAILVAVAATHHLTRVALLTACAALSSLLLGLLDRLQSGGYFRASPVMLRAAADLVLLTPLTVLFYI